MSTGGYTTAGTPDLPGLTRDSPSSHMCNVGWRVDGGLWWEGGLASWKPGGLRGRSPPSTGPKRRRPLEGARLPLALKAATHQAAFHGHAIGQIAGPAQWQGGGEMPGEEVRGRGT